jgi:hypothetical protein
MLPKWLVEATDDIRNRGSNPGVSPHILLIETLVQHNAQHDFSADQIIEAFEAVGINMGEEKTASFVLEDLASYL